MSVVVPRITYHVSTERISTPKRKNGQWICTSPVQASQYNRSRARAECVLCTFSGLAVLLITCKMPIPALSPPLIHRTLLTILHSMYIRRGSTYPPGARLYFYWLVTDASSHFCCLAFIGRTVPLSDSSRIAKLAPVETHFR